MTKACIYTRVSLDQTGEGLAVERQEQECRDFCEARGWTVVRVLTDNSISATRGKVRPAFRELLATRDEYDCVVVWHTDRLVRLTSELLEFINLGLDVHSVRAGHLDLATPAGRAVATTLVAWQQYEGEAKADRQRAAALQRARAGRQWWPTRPLGYERDGTLNEREAEALRHVYSAVLDGEPVTRMAEWLNQQGYRTGRGNKWTQPSLRQTLLAARNIGLREYKGEVAGAAAWPAIVDEDTWRAVVHKLSDPTRKIGRRGMGRAPGHLLTGIAVCGKCGGPIRKAARNGHAIYSCRTNYCATADLEWADSYTLRHLIRLAPTYSHLWPLGGADGDAAGYDELQQQRRALVGRKEGAAAAYADGQLDLQQMLAATQRIDTRLAELDEKLAEAASAYTASMELADPLRLAELFVDMTLSRRKALIREVFDSILLLPRQRGEHTPGKLELVPRVLAVNP